MQQCSLPIMSSQPNNEHSLPSRGMCQVTSSVRAPSICRWPKRRGSIYKVRPRWVCVPVQSASSGPCKCKSTSRVRSSSQAGSFCLSFFISVVVGLVELKYSSENGNCKRRKPLDGTDGGKCNLGVFFSTLVLSHSSFMVIQSFPIRIKSRLADGNSLGQTPDPRLNFCRVETGGTSMAVYHGSKYGDLASWKVEHLFV